MVVREGSWLGRFRGVQENPSTESARWHLTAKLSLKVRIRPEEMRESIFLLRNMEEQKRREE